MVNKKLKSKSPLSVIRKIAQHNKDKGEQSEIVLNPDKYDEMIKDGTIVENDDGTIRWATAVAGRMS